MGPIRTSEQDAAGAPPPEWPPAMWRAIPCPRCGVCETGGDWCALCDRAARQDAALG